MIAGKTWREIRVMTLVYAFVLELELVLSILLWPELREAVPAALRLFPAQFIRNIAEAMADPHTGFRAYMAVEMFFKGINIVGVACAILLGTGIIARERENRTLEFLLSRPISRSSILWSKFWVTAVAIVVPILVTSWSAIPISWIVDEELPFSCVTVGAVHSALFCLTFLCLTTALSVRMRTQVHVAFVIGVAIVVEVGIYFISTIRVVSAFRLSDFDIYGPVMAGNLSFGRLFGQIGIWLALACVLAYVLADRLLQRAEP